MSEENNKLVQTGKLGPRKVGLGASLQEARNKGNIASETVVNFAGYPNRIVIALDDSGSMSSPMNGQSLFEESEHISPSRMNIAKQACEAFLQVCSPSDTVVGLYTISTDKSLSLSWDYKPLYAMLKEVEDSGGTPTFETLDKIKHTENVSRVVLISDGCSNSGIKYEILDLYKNNNPKISIDGVFIGGATDTYGIDEMKRIAEYTGGLFIHFKDASSFASQFKYLAPAFYGMLCSGEIKL
jgi:hypothetical protein